MPNPSQKEVQSVLLMYTHRRCTYVVQSHQDPFYFLLFFIIFLILDHANAISVAFTVGRGSTFSVAMTATAGGNLDLNIY